MENTNFYSNLDLKDIYYFDPIISKWVFEIWKDVIGYEKKYQCSNLGRMKSLKRLCLHSNGTIQPIKERILSLGTHAQGYKQAYLNNKNKSKTFKVHILVAKEFIPNPLNLPEVNHKKGIKSDNMYWSLEWNTSKENSIHAVKTGLRVSLKGSSHKQSKLTEAQVLEIREIGRSKKLKDIGDIYNVGIHTISLILNRKTWKHI